MIILPVVFAAISGVLYDAGVSFSSVLELAQSSSSMPDVSTDKVKQWQPPTPEIKGRSAVPSIPITPEQQKEVDKAKSEVQQLKQEENTRSGPKTFPDKKTELWQRITLQHQGLQASRTGKLYASLPITSRPGVFLVTANDSSSSSGSFPGGHAGMVYSSQNVVESFGNRGSQDGVYYYPNNWETRYRSVVARSVKGTTVDQDRQAALRAGQQVTKPYNYNFWSIDQDNSFYCSQLVYRQFKLLFNVNLNDNGGAVWPNDLSASQNATTIYSQ